MTLNISEVKVDHIDAELFEGGNRHLNRGPIVPKNLRVFRLCFYDYFIGVIGGLVKVGAGEIEQERGRDHTHLGRPKVVVKEVKLGYSESAHVADVVVVEPQIDVSFVFVVVFAHENLDGGRAICKEYDSLSA